MMKISRMIIDLFYQANFIVKRSCGGKRLICGIVPHMKTICGVMIFVGKEIFAPSSEVQFSTLR